MDPHEEIKNWLESDTKDFDAGYKLFVRFSRNRSIAMYLERKRYLPKLKYELQKLSTFKVLKDAHPAAPKKVSHPAQPVQPVISKPKPEIIKVKDRVEIIQDGKVRYEDLPEYLKSRFDDNQRDYKIIRSLHEQMKLAKTDEERSATRKKIDSLDDSIAMNWNMIDDWANGKEPEKQDKQVFKQINAARTYLSRNILKIESLTGDKKEKMKADLLERVNFLTAEKAEISAETIAKLVKHGVIETIKMG